MGPPAAAQQPDDIAASIHLVWSGTQAQLIADTGAFEQVWSIDTDREVRFGHVGEVGLRGPVAVLGTTTDEGPAQVELRSIGTGQLICAGEIARDNIGTHKGWSPRIATADVLNGTIGNEAIFTAYDRDGQPALFYAVDSSCQLAREIASGVGEDRVDGLAFADATGDGRTNIIAMYGASLYPSEQPAVEVVSFEENAVEHRVQGSYTGSGMTRLAVGDLTQDGRTDFLTGGWWGPRVAAWGSDGGLLWDGDPTNDCGGADMNVHIEETDGEPIVLVAGSSYSPCSPTEAARVTPTDGQIVWKEQLEWSARGLHKMAVGPLEGADGIVALYRATHVSACANDQPILLLDVETGKRLATRCGQTPTLTPQGLRMVDPEGDGLEDLYATTTGPFDTCGEGEACLVQLDVDLGTERSFTLGSAEDWSLAGLSTGSYAGPGLGLGEDLADGGCRTVLAPWICDEIASARTEAEDRVEAACEGVIEGCDPENAPGATETLEAACREVFADAICDKVRDLADPTTPPPGEACRQVFTDELCDQALGT